MTTKYMEISRQITPEEFHKSDWFLRMLVNAVNHTNSVIPITLNVGGVLISGELIGGEHYFNGFADDAKRFGADDELPTTFRKYSEMYTKVKGTEPDHDTYEAPQYIHLRKARFIHPSGGKIPGQSGAWWRGRLEAVDGFVQGMLAAD